VKLIFTRPSLGRAGSQSLRQSSSSATAARTAGDGRPRPLGACLPPTAAAHTMRLEFSGRVLEHLNGKRNLYLEGGSRELQTHRMRLTGCRRWARQAPGRPRHLRARERLQLGLRLAAELAPQCGFERAGASQSRGAARPAAPLEPASSSHAIVALITDVMLCASQCDSLRYLGVDLS
jgi:hypothetical protein